MKIVTFETRLEGGEEVSVVNGWENFLLFLAEGRVRTKASKWKHARMFEE